LRVRVRVYGSVQGVGFRYFVREVALSSQLRGWVRNLRDGSVEALFDGPDAEVKRALERCRKGPPLASVERFEVSPEEESETLSGFDISS
jgi:acylphosphatase